MKKKELK